MKKNIQSDSREESVPLLGSDGVDKTESKKEIEVVILMLCVIATGSFNTVARKIMTQPMGQYSFFVTLFNAAAYVVLYFGILFFRYFYSHHVTKGMLCYPWKSKFDPKKENHKFWEKVPPLKYFVLIGFLESLGTILSIVATPYLSGPMTPILGQTTVFFSMLVSSIMFRAKYNFWQVSSVLLVVGGALIPIIPEFLGQCEPKTTHYGYYIIMAFASLPSTISFALKEKMFQEEKSLDLFVVNSASSLFQLLWWPAMVPLTVLLHQTGNMPLLTYVDNGFECLLGSTPIENGPTGDLNCSPNPYPYIVYIGCNLIFNIFVLLLIKKASALQSFMALNGVLSTSVLLFYLKWPLIGHSTIDIWVILSLIVVVIGLVLYRVTSIIKDRKNRSKGSFNYR